MTPLLTPAITANASPKTAASQHTPITLEGNLQALLDHSLRLLQEGQAVAAFRLLGAPLSALWTEVRSCGKAEAMRVQCADHPLHALVQQDPYTHRAATKPRGYAGDAVMMDFIYRGSPAGQGSAVTPLGLAIFAATTRASMGLSVMYRRQLLRSLIDDTVARVDGARMLSVASGHCRELDGSLVAAPLFTGEFVALDQDAESCAEVARSQSHPADGATGSAAAGSRVTVVNEGVRSLLGGPLAASLGHFDLIYSAGLYDYLPETLARRLTGRLLQMLRPGGRLLIGNFVPGGSGRGYMELFMDWPLVVRDEAALRELAQAAGARSVSSFLDPHRNVAYVDVGLEPQP